MREKYESLSLVVLRDLAKARGLKNISSMKKSDLVNRMLEEDARKQKERRAWRTQEGRRGDVKAKEGSRRSEDLATENIQKKEQNMYQGNMEQMQIVGTKERQKEPVETQEKSDGICNGR